MAVSTIYLHLALSDPIFIVNSYAGKAPIHRTIPPLVTSGLLTMIESEMRSLEMLISVKKGMYRVLEKEREEELLRLCTVQAEEEKAKKAVKGKAEAVCASTESALCSSTELSGWAIEESRIMQTMHFIKKCILFLPNIPTNLVESWQECWLGGVSNRGFKSDG